MAFCVSRAANNRCLTVRRSVNRFNRPQTRHGQVLLRSAAEEKSELQTTTEKYGLEAGLLKALTTEKPQAGPSRTEQAKQLLTQYGSAYLLTSISFAIVSFTACYALVSAGVDVASLLGNFGLDVQSGSTQEAVGTFAIAYAAHKALSPVRFPPTVALTPVVAKFLKKDKKEVEGN